jgi:hypothetical protein
MPYTQSITRINFACSADESDLVVEISVQPPAFSSLEMELEGNELTFRTDGIDLKGFRGLLRDLQVEVEGVIAEVKDTDLG